MKLSKLRHLAIATVALLGLSLPASAGCIYVEGGVGASMSRDHLSSGGSIDLNQTGMLGSLGVFCRIGAIAAANGMFVDFGGRGTLTNSKGDLGGAEIKSDQVYEALVRAGYRYHEKVELYAQTGAAWGNIKLPAGLGSETPMAWNLGAGARAHISGGWWAGVEGDYYMARKVDVLGADLTQDTLTARLTLTYFFGEPLQAQRPLK